MPILNPVIVVFFSGDKRHEITKCLCGRYNDLKLIKLSG